MTTITLALDGADPLAHAIAYAQLGWRVVPILPGQKRPAVDRWTERATTDPELIAQWWQANPQHGVGVATGPASGIFALDVDPTHGGADSLAALEAANGRLPDTVEAITGGGGRHLLFWWPRLQQGQRLGNSAGRLGPGLDIRGDGGQIVVAPTMHPTSGRRYEWELSSRPGEAEVAEAPAWLLALLLEDHKPLPEGQVSTRPYDHAFAWDAYNASGNGTAIALLEGAGWHSPRSDRDGTIYLTRPGKAPGQGSGATVGRIAPGVAMVFTSEAPPLEAEHAYAPAELYAALHHQGDRRAADAALCAQSGLAPTYAVEEAQLEAWVAGEHARAVALGLAPGNGDNEGNGNGEGEGIGKGSSWVRTTLGDTVRGLIDGTIERQRPTLGLLPDGKGIFYAGRVNGLYGEPGKGKTWVALGIVAEVLADGGTVAWIDLEEPALGIVERLLTLGVDGDAIVGRFAHYAPEEPIANAIGFGEELRELGPDLVVIDSTGEALAIEGAGPNNDDEVATWFRTWPRWIANLTGAGVIVIDHVVKDESSRGLWPGGSQRKKAAINGSAFMASTIAELGRGFQGRLKLTTSKDRQGHHRVGTPAAIFVLDATGGESAEARLEFPIAEKDNADALEARMKAVSEWLGEMGEAATKAAITKGVGGNNGLTADAIAALTRLGCIQQEQRGQTHYCTLARPFVVVHADDERLPWDADE